MKRNPRASRLLTPGLDNTRLFLSLTAGAGTRCMSLPFSWNQLLSHSRIVQALVKEFSLEFCDNKKTKFMKD